ncbi:MAG: type II secretion system F family protein [Chloroflexota bacterium]|nr:type II secretion system F family protein [Chloroflexota bacterium]
MSLLVPIVLVAAVLVGLVLISVKLLQSRESTSIEDRLDEFGTLEEPPTLEEIELSEPFTDRMVIPLLEGLADLATRINPQGGMENIQHNLDLAGNPYEWSPMQFVGFRLLAALLLGGLGLVVLVLAKGVGLPRRVALTGVMAVGGYYLPSLWLRSKTSSRQREIRRSLPDALDLLTICVEAGLGFDAAIARVAEKWDNELSREFRRVLQEIQLGKLRREALRNMANRIEVPEVSTFVAAIVQAEELGVSIAKVLRIQADEMRRRRRQRAEELARQAPIKMLPAIAFLIFPAIFVVLLGPAVLRVMTMSIGIGGLGGGGLP